MHLNTSFTPILSVSITHHDNLFFPLNTPQKSTLNLNSKEFDEERAVRMVRENYLITYHSLYIIVYCICDKSFTSKTFFSKKKSSITYRLLLLFSPLFSKRDCVRQRKHIQKHNILNTIKYNPNIYSTFPQVSIALIQR